MTYVVSKRLKKENTAKALSARPLAGFIGCAKTYLGTGKSACAPCWKIGRRCAKPLPLEPDKEGQIDMARLLNNKLMLVAAQIAQKREGQVTQANIDK